MPGFHEHLSLGHLTWVVGEHPSNVGAQEQHFVSPHLEEENNWMIIFIENLNEIYWYKKYDFWTWTEHQFSFQIECKWLFNESPIENKETELNFNIALNIIFCILPDVFFLKIICNSYLVWLLVMQQTPQVCSVDGDGNKTFVNKLFTL